MLKIGILRIMASILIWGILSSCGLSQSSLEPTTTQTALAPASTRIPTATVPFIPSVTPNPTPTPSSTPSPTPTQPPSRSADETGPFRRVISLAGLLPDSSSDLLLRPLADGSLWIITSQAVLRWDGQLWETVLSEKNEFLASVDDYGRLWVLRQDMNTISAWQDGQWTTYDRSSGWTDAFTTDPNWWAPSPWSAYSGPTGTIWLPMAQDVRVFNGETWNLYTLEDMGFPPPDWEGLEVIHRLAMLDGGAQVWIGECYYSGPGPMGGQGVRQFDGNTWHAVEGSVGSGCVSIMEVDLAGNLWLGTMGTVWRYEPASQVWTPYSLPDALLSDFNFSFPLQLAVDGAEDVWAMMLLCGGASCSGPTNLYRIHAGEWTLIAESQDGSMLKQLALDGSGQAWLFWDRVVYQLEGTSMKPVASINARGVGVSPDGKVWVVDDYEDNLSLYIMQP